MNDTERKVLQILWSLYRGNQGAGIINIKRLVRLSQRSQGQVNAALKGLADSGHIQRDGMTAKVLRMPELEIQQPNVKWWELE